jgi:1-acyl-sn-glycerol-3-phosphate acyltransferase
VVSAETVLRLISAPLCLRAVRRRLATVTGLEHFPTTGPVIVCPNHRSYFDHFVVSVLVGAVTGKPVWFLTKSQSFERRLPRLWARAWRGIPVDRDAPTPETLRSVRSVLADGAVLCVYPEGTRNVDGKLLPFKAGAFRFALTTRTPVVPLALFGTDDVLSKGDRWLRPGGRIDARFGKPLLPNPTLHGQKSAADLSDRTRASLIELLSGPRGALPISTRDIGEDAGDFLDRRTTSSLDEAGRLSQREGRTLLTLAGLLAPMEPRPHHVAVQKARLIGLSAGTARLPFRLVRAMRMKRIIDSVLAGHPSNAQANYLLGRWHLAMPTAMGASRQEAVVAFERSCATSRPDDSRALSGLAEAQSACGLHEAAAATLESVLLIERAHHDVPTARAQKCERRLREMRETGLIVGTDVSEGR